MTTPTEPPADRPVKSGDPCPFCRAGQFVISASYSKGAAVRTYIVCNACGENGPPYDRAASEIRRRPKRKRDLPNKVKSAPKPVPAPAPPADTGGMKELPPAHASVIALHELPGATGLSLNTLGVMALAERMPRPVVTEGAVLFDRLEIERWNRDHHAPPHAALPPRNAAERERVEWAARTFDERAKAAVARIKAETAGAN